KQRTDVEFSCRAVKFINRGKTTETDSGGIGRFFALRPHSDRMRAGDDERSVEALFFDPTRHKFRWFLFGPRSRLDESFCFPCALGGTIATFDAEFFAEGFASGRWIDDERQLSVDPFGKSSERFNEGAAVPGLGDEHGLHRPESVLAKFPGINL